MEMKMLLTSFVLSVAVIVLPSYASAARYRSTKALTAKSSSLRTDGSTSRKQSYLRIYGRPPKFVTLRENEDIVIECGAGGSPPPVIHWLKDGQLISETDWDTLSVDGDENFDWDKGGNPKLGISSTKSKLYLDCASLKTSGEYTCVAENPYQRISSNTAVNFVPSSQQTSPGHCDDKLKLEKSPRIIMWSDKRLEFMNGAVRLFCRASGNPKPTIEWLDTEGQPVRQDWKKYQILSSGDLVIQNLKWSHMGLYTCVASNIHGTDRIETFLYPTAIDKN